MRTTDAAPGPAPAPATPAPPPDRLHWAARPARFPVTGDCLAPVGIVHGDIAIVDLANTRPEHGDIVACRLNGRRLLKAYLTDDREFPVRLGYTEEGEFRSFAVLATDRLEIIGVLAGVVPCGKRRWPDWATHEVVDQDVQELTLPDLLKLDHWTLDTKTQEWVRRTGDGTELWREPSLPPHAAAAAHDEAHRARAGTPEDPDRQS